MRIRQSYKLVPGATLSSPVTGSVLWILGRNKLNSEEFDVVKNPDREPKFRVLSLDYLLHSKYQLESD